MLKLWVYISSPKLLSLFVYTIHYSEALHNVKVMHNNSSIDRDVIACVN